MSTFKSSMEMLSDDTNMRTADIERRARKMRARKPTIKRIAIRTVTKALVRKDS
jgi:replicative DNA helicase